MANILSLLNLMVIFWLSLNSTSGKICPRFVGTGIKLLSTNNQSFSCGSYDAFTCETECHTCVASILITGSYRLFGMVIVRSYDDFPDSFINLNGQISVDCRSRFLTVGRVIGAFGSRIDVETDSTVEISNLNIWEWGVLHVGSNVTIGETVSSAVRTITVGAKSTLSIHNSLTSVTRVLLDNTELSIGRNSPSVFDFGGETLILNGSQLLWENSSVYFIEVGTISLTNTEMQVSSSDFAVQDAELFLTEAKWHIVESTVEIDTNSRLTVDDSSFNFQNANFSTVDAKVHFESISLSLAPSTILRFGNCEIQNLNKSLEIKLGEDSSLTINWPYQSQDPSPTRIFCTLVGSISIPSGSQLAETDVAEMLKCDSKPFAETIVKATISEAYLSSFQAPINSKKVDKHVNECPIDFPTSTSVTKLSTTSSATIIFTQFSFYVLIILLSFTQNYQI